MSKSSRKYTARQNRTSFDPDTKARARKDLRSTERDHDVLTGEIPAGRRGLSKEEQSE